MTRRFNFLFVLTLVFAMCATTLMAQPLVSEQSSDDEISSLTKDPKPYSPKPKDMWELGVHGGYLAVGADTPLRVPFAGFGGGVSLRKSLGYTFSLRADFSRLSRFSCFHVTFSIKHKTKTGCLNKVTFWWNVTATLKNVFKPRIKRNFEQKRFYKKEYPTGHF